MELDSVHRDWVREMTKAYYEILDNITFNMATESTLANQMLAVNAKLQVSMKRPSITRLNNVADHVFYMYVIRRLLSFMLSVSSYIVLQL